MHVAVAGSGPAGMTTALLLARQGHRVTLVDRDPGPVPGEPWQRVGVMQFHLPHALRVPGRDLLRDRLPDVLEALLALGAVDEPSAGLHVRRSVLEQVMWERTSVEPGVTRLTGHVDTVAVEDGTATGLVVDGRLVPADLVVDAGGRAGRFDAHRPAGESVDSGMAYASRIYRLRPGAEPGPLNGGPGFVSVHDGFLVMVFVHDAGTFSVLLVRLSSDHELAAVRDERAFDGALALVPAVAAWTDPSRAYPIDHVRAGAGLANMYRPQSRTVHRLVAVGDAVCTTNPAAGRGLSLGMRSAAALADLVATAPPETWAGRLDAWCQDELLPWYLDHLGWDASTRAMWDGKEPDPAAPIAWDVVAAAAREHPEFMRLLGPFLEMRALPPTIDPLREQVREMLRAGWRPPRPTGPTRADLAEAVRAAQPEGALAPRVGVPA